MLKINIEEIFTKDGEKVDLEVNKLTAECITSKNNTFSLDNEGNLSINSLTTIKPIIDILYPVGAYFISSKNTNPSNFFGGTWERVKGRFLVGVDEDQTEFNTPNKIGGEKTHKLTINEMPSHSHLHDIENTVVSVSGSGAWTPCITGTGNPSFNQNSRNTGGDQAHNNLPPYETCYIWKRTI